MHLGLKTEVWEYNQNQLIFRGVIDELFSLLFVFQVIQGDKGRKTKSRVVIQVQLHWIHCREQLDCKMLRAVPFTFVQHIPSFLKPPLTESLWSSQAKKELAVLLDVKRQPWKSLRKISTWAKLAAMHTKKIMADTKKWCWFLFWPASCLAR